MPARPKQLVTAINDALQSHREELGLSHEEISAKAGVHRSTVSRILSGKISGTLFVYAAIAEAMEISLGELLTEIEKKK